MTDSVFFGSALASLAFQVAAGVAASAAVTEKYFDLCGAANFVALASLALYGADFDVKNSRAATLALMVAVWSLRLGSFLFARVREVGEDKRFRRIKTKPALFVAVHALQAAWVVLVACPLLLQRGDGSPPPGAAATDAVGAALFVAGLAVEVTADAQKTAWRRRRKAEGKTDRESFITSGLWRYARHPNYFGEITLWCGFWVVAAPGLDGAARLAALLSPAFTYALLVHVSGVPPLERRFRDNEAYQRYRAATNMLVPWPPRAKSS